MRLDPRDLTFIAEKLPSVEGWLIDDAAYLTCALMRSQTSDGVTGSIFEIGVFAGKYLSLLFHASQDTKEIVVGLDTFQWYPRKKVDANFSGLFSDLGRLKLMTCDSTKVDRKELDQTLGGKPRYISVDGAHTAPEVEHDLDLSESLLAPGGIVAIDDFLNPRAIGVGEGAYRYFLKRNREGLVPFAYCANKLFAARMKDAVHYNREVWTFADDNPSMKMSEEFTRLTKQGRNWVEQELLGFRVLIF